MRTKYNKNRIIHAGFSTAIFLCILHVLCKSPNFVYLYSLMYWLMVLFDYTFEFFILCSCFIISIEYVYFHARIHETWWKILKIRKYFYPRDRVVRGTLRGLDFRDWNSMRRQGIIATLYGQSMTMCFSQTGEEINCRFIFVFSALI